jgi:hypothetical protein
VEEPGAHRRGVRDPPRGTVIFADVVMGDRTQTGMGAMIREHTRTRPTASSGRRPSSKATR